MEEFLPLVRDKREEEFLQNYKRFSLPILTNLMYEEQLKRKPREMTDTANETPKGVLSVNCKHEDSLEKIELSFDFKGTVTEALETFGEETVLYYWYVGARKALRDRLYALAHRTKKEEDLGENVELAELPTAEEILATLQDWVPKPGSTKTRKSADEKAMDSFDKLSGDEQNAFIRKLQEKQASTVVEDGPEDETEEE